MSLDQLTQADMARLIKRARQLRHDDTYEDLLQDALLKACECVHKFGGRSSLTTWIGGIIGNVAMNHNTVQYGRNGRPGRRGLMAQYVAEYKRLHCPHGRRTSSVMMAAKQREWR